MFYLLYPLREDFIIFNLLRYITFRSAYAAITSLLVSLIFGRGFILFLKNLGNHYLWQDEAQAALLGRTTLAHGIPIGYDGENSLSQLQGRELGKNNIYKHHPWIQAYLPAASFAIFGESTFSARFLHPRLHIIARDPIEEYTCCRCTHSAPCHPRFLYQDYIVCKLLCSYSSPTPGGASSYDQNVTFDLSWFFHPSPLPFVLYFALYPFLSLSSRRAPYEAFLTSQVQTAIRNSHSISFRLLIRYEPLPVHVSFSGILKIQWQPHQPRHFL